MIELATDQVRAERIKQARAKIGISQRALAEKVDIDASGISRWEDGHCPDLQDVRVAALLGMTPNQYLLASPVAEDAFISGLTPDEVSASREIIELMRRHREQQRPGLKSPFQIVLNLLRDLNEDLGLAPVAIPSGTVIRKDSSMNLRTYEPTNSEEHGKASRISDPMKKTPKKNGVGRNKLAVA